MRPLLDGTDVVSLCSNLVRFDTTNYEHGRAKGESRCADYIETLLARTPFTVRRYESAVNRANLVVTVPGTQPDLPSLICQGHLDVVPADPAQWSFDPFSGEISGGYVYGRGSVDMKDFVACMIRVLLVWAQRGTRPTHTTVFAFLADEETDGAFGALWLVEQHPELFGNAQFALGESGGMRIPWTDASGAARNFYPIATGERGTAHLQIVAHGAAGHGSFARDDNAVVMLAHAVTNLASHTWPVRLTHTMSTLLDRVGAVRGRDLHAIDLNVEGGLAELLAELGPLAPIVNRSFQPSTVPTMLKAGYKVNVIPERAQASIDVRTLPGDEESMLTTVDRLLGPALTRTFIAHEPALESSTDTAFYRALCDTLLNIDPTGVPVPFVTGGGTDAKALSRLGIESYGFSPSCAGPQGQHAEGAHGVDERVPVDSLRFAERVLNDLLLWT